MHPKEDGTLKIVDKTMNATSNEECKLKWDIDLFQYTTDEDK